MKSDFELNPFKITASSTMINRHNSLQGSNVNNCNKRSGGEVIDFDEDATLASTAQRLFPCGIRADQDLEKSDDIEDESEEIFRNPNDNVNQVVPQTENFDQPASVSSVSVFFLISDFI